MTHLSTTKYPIITLKSNTPEINEEDDNSLDSFHVNYDCFINGLVSLIPDRMEYTKIRGALNRQTVFFFSSSFS